jgi:hypothetical protein
MGRLALALSTVVRRHEALRYLFHEHGEGSWRVTSTESDAFGLSEVDPESETGEIIWDAAVGGDVLARLVDFGPRRAEHLAAYLTRRGDRRRLLLVVDHMVADARACDVLLADVAEAFRKQTEPAGVVPDTAGRSGIVNMRAACDLATIPESMRPLAQVMREKSAFAWVDLPAILSWDEPQRDAIVTDVPMPFDMRAFERACAANRCTRFAALTTATHFALREISSEPGYLYLYPSVRELFGVDGTVGWFSGMAVLELEPAGVDGANLRRRYTKAIARAVTDGWAISEQLHAYARTPERLPTRPSVTVDPVVEPSERIWDFGTCLAREIATQQPRVPVRGRICFGMAVLGENAALRLLSEPGRYSSGLIDGLARSAAAALTAMVQK